jgi:hypothetical protein
MARIAIQKRIKLLKTIAQYVPPATTTTPTTVPSTTYNAPTYNIMSIPGFKANLFRVRPDIINNINQIANFINQNLVKLSSGQISIINTYLTPAMNPSQFSNDLKHLFALAKWVYYVIVSNKTPYYTIQGLVSFANDLIENVQSKSFVNTSIHDRLVILAQTMLATLKP